ncbi:hypothetical protein MARA_31260 [Mycolicibacterium arabiense]|uniref:Uncharacterized protein n=1 Tax=Mycolicibacterium arabiense TaxID=1286181 RepID=A0A7I7RYE0_9MYCO|nr:hypothetical protein MARA_31260 [Mycolicibacterium arabiense]
MDHGVDVTVANHLRDERVSDVGPDELRPAHPPLQILARRHRVDRYDVIDLGILRETRDEVATEEPACAGDQNHLRVERRIPWLGSSALARPLWGPPARAPVSIHRVSLTAANKDYLPSFLRCTRVRRSSLRCFFFDMRLRRFLMTEPIYSATYAKPKTTEADDLEYAP